jgi:hypothetical protein
MNKLLLLLSLSGCMSMTHHAVTQTECAPTEMVLLDLFGSMLVTSTGIIEREPVAVGIGTFMLAGSVLSAVHQMANCQ